MRRGLVFAALLTIAIALGAMFIVVVWDMRQQEAARQVHFEVSCGARIQRLFNGATVRLHSMGYFGAERAYKAIAEIEPDCAIAYWGMAISRLKRPIAITPLPEDMVAAREALGRASNAKIATPRERAYIAAAGVLIGDGDLAGWHDRTLRYEKAMAELAAGHPLDKEATIFYALALNMAAPPSDKSFAKQTKAAELLLIALSGQPNHPGLTHYLTYCLSLPSDRTQEVSAALPPRATSWVQTALAMLAFAGVVAFFAAVLPVWSGR